MATPYFPPRLGRALPRMQPQFPVAINRVSPFTSGLVSALIPRQGVFVDLVANTPAQADSQFVLAPHAGHYAVEYPTTGTGGNAVSAVTDMVTGYVQAMGIVVRSIGDTNNNDFEDTYCHWTDSGVTDGFFLLGEGTGALFVATLGGNTAGNGGPDFRGDGLWHHVVAVFDQVGNRVQFFLDGEFHSEKTSYIDNSAVSAAVFGPQPGDVSGLNERYGAFYGAWQWPEHPGNEFFAGLSADLYQVLRPAAPVPVYVPSVIDALGALNAITAASTVGQPTLGQEHALGGSPDNTAAATMGQPTLGQVHILGGSPDNTAVITMGQPTLGQEHALGGAPDTTASPTMGQPTLGQVHALGGAPDNTAQPTMGTPTIDRASGDTSAGRTQGRARGQN